MVFVPLFSQPSVTVIASVGPGDDYQEGADLRDNLRWQQDYDRDA
jgi:hypothetical protein